MYSQNGVEPPPVWVPSLETSLSLTAQCPPAWLALALRHLSPRAQDSASMLRMLVGYSAPPPTSLANPCAHYTCQADQKAVPENSSAPSKARG